MMRVNPAVRRWPGGKTFAATAAAVVLAASSLSADARNACYACHQKPENGVFTRYRR